jgi:hypothetical protein
MTTFPIHTNNLENCIKIQCLALTNEIDFHELDEKLRISLENSRNLVQTTKINFIKRSGGIL